jgi:hypothetical protein
MTTTSHPAARKRFATTCLVAAGVLAALLFAAAATAQVTGLYYQEVRRDGRIYVFNTYENYHSFEATGAMNKDAITLPGRGPNGETLVGDNATAIDLFLFKNNLPAYDRPTPAPKPAAPSPLKRLHVGGTFYLSFQNGTAYAGTPGQTTSYSKFVLKRGYLDVSDDITPWFTGRITTDIYQNAAGDYQPRIKYLYGSFHWQGNEFFSQPYVNFGQVVIPWLDWDEAVNRYRMQDEMFLERNGILNSADDGILVGSNLGGLMSEEYRKNVDGAYAGRYGSWQLGIYNGNGYHAAEKNQNKALEARLSLRPLPDAVPGLQFTVFGVNGKGNVASVPGKSLPEWTVFDGMVSYETAHFTGQAEYFSGKGNQGGTALNADGSARKQKGYSLFANVRLGEGARWGVIGRYDHFDPNPDRAANVLDDVTKMSIVGVSYAFSGPNVCLLDYQVKKHTDPGIPDEKRVQLTLQVKF